jgi:hydrogenase nickel incorporation protein HypB
MFAAADMMLLNKIDLLPYIDFDVAQCIDYARRVNPRIKVLQVSARTGEGLDFWLQWLKASHSVASIG